MTLEDKYLFYMLLTQLERSVNKLTKEQILECFRLAISNGPDTCLECVDHIVAENKQRKKDRHVD